MKQTLIERLAVESL